MGRRRAVRDGVRAVKFLASRARLEHNGGTENGAADVFDGLTCEVVEAREFISREDARARGLIHFFTGAECRNGHAAERYVNDGKCVTCVRGRVKRYVAKNPEKAKSAIRRWYLDNKEMIAKRHKERRERLRDKILAEKRIYQKTYYLANKLKFRNQSRNRRARIRSAEGSHTHDDIMRIGKAQKWRCGWCRKPCKDNYHVDHIVAIASGGTNRPSNLLVTCPACNLAKSAKDPIDFAREKGKLL